MKKKIAYFVPLKVTVRSRSTTKLKRPLAKEKVAGRGVPSCTDSFFELKRPDLYCTKSARLK